MAKFSIRFKGKGWGIGMQHSKNIWLPFLLKTGEYGGCSYYETMPLFLDCFKVKGWGREGGGGLSNLTDGFVSISFGPVILIKKV